MQKYSICDKDNLFEKKVRSGYIYKTTPSLRQHLNDFIDYISLYPFQQINKSNNCTKEYIYRIDLSISNKNYLLAAKYTIDNIKHILEIIDVIFYPQ